MKSRNEREGKFIPGWCYNPNPKHAVWVFGKGVCEGNKTIRAGGNHKLTKMKNDLLGLAFFRQYREGAFE